MNLVRFAPHSDTLGAHENVAIQADHADEAEIKLREAEYADKRTREARHAISALGKNITELETAAIVSSLINVVSQGSFGHTQTGKTVVECLLDVQGALDLENAQ